MSKPPRDHRSRLGLLGAVVAWSLGCILLTGCAGPQPADAPGDGQVAQSPTDRRAAPPRPDTRGLTAVSQKEEIDRGCEKEDRSADAVAASISARKRAAAERVATGGPAPSWTCVAQTITLEPVWQGKSMEYDFLIRNTGQADLTIQLRKG